MNVRAVWESETRTVEREFAHSTYAAVLADVPATLFPYWSETSRDEFPRIPRAAAFYAQAAEGLMMFFDCMAAAGKPCGLPSRAADSVWHAWTRMDAPGLEAFCIRHFGRVIPHVERAQMQEDMNKALGACLVQARRRASRPVAGPSLPRLFSLDARLGMPHGFGYRIVGGLVACSSLDAFGNSGKKLSFPDGLTSYGLFQAGLISAAEYDEGARLSGIHALRFEGEDSFVDHIGADIEAGGDGGAGDGAASCSGGGSCGGGCGGGGCGGS